MLSRNNKGSVAALLPAVILIVIVAIGAFAVDTSHNVTVRTELQSASDAAALAGARDLLTPETENNADSTALSVAEDNTADGKPVSNATNGCMVTSQTSSWDNATNSATVTLNCDKTIGNIFAKMFGHKSDLVKTQSIAQCWRSIVGIDPNTGFPLMVSIDTNQGNAKPLYQMKVGDNFDIYINSQKFKNGAWTSFKLPNTNAQWLKDAVRMGLGLDAMRTGVFTGIDVGEKASLGNGVMAQKELAKGELLDALTAEGATFVLPVMRGEPPYNQDREVVGFISIHPTGVEINKSGGEVEIIHAKLVKGINKGEGGLPKIPGKPDIEAGMAALSTGTVQLVR